MEDLYSALTFESHHSLHVGLSKSFEDVLDSLLVYGRDLCLPGGSAWRANWAGHDDTAASPGVQ